MATWVSAYAMRWASIPAPGPSWSGLLVAVPRAFVGPSEREAGEYAETCDAAQKPASFSIQTFVRPVHMVVTMQWQVHPNLMMTPPVAATSGGSLPLRTCYAESASEKGKV